jgi:translation initiation factor IF-3
MTTSQVRILPPQPILCQVFQQENLTRRTTIAGKQKEMKFSVRISDHDYGYRLKQIEKFLKDKDTVLATVQFKGREITHFDLGEQVLNRLITDLGGKARTAGKPALKGKSLQVLILPK